MNRFVKIDSQGWKTHEKHKLISTEAQTEDPTVELIEKKTKNIVSIDSAVYYLII